MHVGEEEVEEGEEKRREEEAGKIVAYVVLGSNLRSVSPPIRDYRVFFTIRRVLLFKKIFLFVFC